MFQCSKNYGSPTCSVTMLKVPPNMADPISLRDSDHWLKATESLILIGSAILGATFNLVTRIGLP